MDSKTKTQYQFHVNQCVDAIFKQRFTVNASESEKKRMILMEIVKLLNITHNINQLHIIDLINNISLNDSVLLKNTFNKSNQNFEDEYSNDNDSQLENSENEDSDNEDNDNKLNLKNILSYQNSILNLEISHQNTDNNSDSDNNSESRTYCFENQYNYSDEDNNNLDKKNNDDDNETSESDIQSQNDMNEILQLNDNTERALNDSGNQCLARVRTIHNKIFNKEINNTAPYWYYRDSDGYSYGYQCKKPRMSGKPCCSMHQPKYDISTISLITEKPIELIKFEKEQKSDKHDKKEELGNQTSQYESSNNSDEEDSDEEDSDEEDSDEEDSNKELTLKRVKIKNKGTFLICRETKEIFTLEDRKLVGSIIDDEFIFD